MVGRYSNLRMTFSLFTIPISGISENQIRLPATKNNYILNNYIITYILMVDL